MIEFFLHLTSKNGRANIVKLSCECALEVWSDVVNKYNRNNKLCKNGMLGIKLKRDDLEVTGYLGLMEIETSYLEYKIIQIKINELRESLEVSLQGEE